MRFEFFMAKRFLVGQRFGVFRLVTTSIAIGGIALGVAAPVDYAGGDGWVPHGHSGKNPRHAAAFVPRQPFRRA